MSRRPCLPGSLLLLAVLLVTPVRAADPARGAGLYLQLPAGLASCVGCHGPDPAANRNNVLRAAGQPAVLLKTLNAVGVMGYLKSALSDDDLVDLSAYLDTVARAAAAGERTVWPRTIEFGTLAWGAASPPQTVWLRNLSAVAIDSVQPRLVAGRFLLEHDCPPALAPGASCRATLRAPSAQPGTFTDALLWGAGSAVVVGLSAQVATATASPPGVLSADPARLDFGALDVGGTAVRSLRWVNSGVADITLGVATLTGPGAAAFSLDGGCAAGTVLMPGQACALALQAQAGAAVAYAASLQWRSNGTNPTPLPLQAQGVAPPAGPPGAAPVAPGGSDSGGAEGGSGGCAVAPPGRSADASLALWLALAVAAAALRRPRPRRP